MALRACAPGRPAQALGFFDPQLRARNPQSAVFQEDLSDCYERLGEAHRGLGNWPKALEFYQKSLDPRQKLLSRNPQSADFAHLVWMSFWNIAEATEQTGGDARTWWRKAYDVLSGMKQRGIMLPTDEQYLEQLRQKVGA